MKVLPSWLLLATGLALAVPAAADPSFVRMFEQERPLAGRPALMIVSGAVHHATAIGLDVVGVTAEETVVVTIHVYPLQNLDIDDHFAYPIELPPCAAATTR